jgi:hypothetical protein
MGYREESLGPISRQLTSGLANQLFNMPLDMISEHRIFHEQPELRATHFVAMAGFHKENLAAYTNKEIEKLTPDNIRSANFAMNIALAMCMDSLFGARTEYAWEYRDADALPSGQKLFGLWQEAMKGFKAGDEYDLVDEFARVLGLSHWYTWGPDDALREEIEKDLRTEDLATLTNPELLKTLEMASTMFLLGALAACRRGHVMRAIRTT